MSERRIAKLKREGNLPQFSTSHEAARAITNKLYELAAHNADAVVVRRYNEFFERFGPSNKGFVGLVIIGCCPSNVCDAALFAFGDV